MNSQMTTEYTM